MKKLKQLTVKTATIDTLLICLVIFIASFFTNGNAIRWILGGCLLMALTEIFYTSYAADTGDRYQEIGYDYLMTTMLLVAICTVFFYHMNWKEYVLCLGLTMASDAGGLFFGRIFGHKKPRFSRKLSPNKTWAGYLGEMATTWALGWLGLWILNMPLNFANVTFVMLGFVVCAIGDLIGSGVKRELGVKHSSDYLNDLPILGKIELIMRSRHGFLDCMDSASFAIIFFVLLQHLGRL